MLTKQDFQEKLKAEFLKQEVTAALYHAGDPRILQILDAQATMLAMLSQQVELAMAEPFIKARNATVLADAANKGLIFTAKPCTVQLLIENLNDTAVTIETGRYLIDNIGRYFKTTEPVQLAPFARGEIKAEQIIEEAQQVTVVNSAPFMAINIEPSDTGAAIYQLLVKVNGQAFSPRYKFNNAKQGDKIFHVESNEFKQLFVKFGANGILGVQPNNGDRVEIIKILTFGDIDLDENSEFSFRYIKKDSDNNVKITLSRVVEAGVNPVDMATLRQLVQYPSVYDDNAVYLGEFDLLLRAKFPQLAFLNVWNEAKEEQVRGANVDNINTLFVAFALPENYHLTKSAVQSQITAVLKKADSSYKIKFVEPVTQEIQCSVNATISQLFGAAEVEKQIKSTLLQSFGKNAFVAKQGKVVVKNKTVADLLRQDVQAIADAQGDFFVQLTTPETRNPETFSYMTNDTISVTLNYNAYESDIWGA